MKKDTLKKFSVFLLPFFFWSIILPGVGLAAPAIPGFYGTVTPPLPAPSVNALPVLRNIERGATVPGASNNRLVIHQNQPKAIINWESFNIGEDVSTHFDQQGNADWAALNRIFDRNPSRIFGKLTADGKIYLINQNGILFSPTSKVNVHSLVASSLNIQDDDFLGGLLNFKAENYQGNFGWDINTNVAVSNHGVIETDKSGSVFLLAPSVENSGVIITPIGQIGLAAGTEVDIPHYNLGGYEMPLLVKNPGEHGFAVNFENGWLIADTGLAGMYGRVVNQDGLIRSVTAVKKAGRIELLASEKVSTGANSMTIVPVSSSLETAHESFSVGRGAITIAGLDSSTPVERFEHSGLIRAPSGQVTMEAEKRVYLEKGSVTDVSGIWVDKSGEANLIEAQLNSVQLRDDYGQKGGLLQGETIIADALTGSAIGDISGHIVSEEMTVMERSTEGGIIDISVSSGDGDIIVKEGAMIDFSGGGIRYGEGCLETTKLLAGDRIYDISEAPQWIQYDKIMGFQEKRHERYGIIEEFTGLYYGGANPLKDYSHGYIKGSNAGSLSLIARNVVLDGQIDGSVEQGLFQTLFQEPEDENGNQTATGYVEPKGGTLSIGSFQGGMTWTVTGNNPRIEEIVVREEVAPLPVTFGTEDNIPDSYFKEAENGSYLKKLVYADGRPVYKTRLSAKKLSGAGLSVLNLNAATRVTIDDDAVLSLRPSGLLEENEFNLSVTARNIHHRGIVDIPGGKVEFFSVSNLTSGIGSALPEDYVSLKDRIYIAEGSKILVNGKQIDNSYINQGSGILSKSGHLDGGSVKLENYSIREIEPGKRTSEVVIEKGSLIDVSGGYEIDEQGNVSGGDAGVLDIQGATLVLGGELKGYSLIGQQGGTVNIHSGLVNVKNSLGVFENSMNSVDYGDEIPDDLYNTCYLAKDYFDETGFTNIWLTSAGELIIDDSVHFSPSMMKMSDPFPNSARQEMSFKNYTGFGTHIKNGLAQVSPDYITSSSVQLTAGKSMAFTGQKYDEIEAPFFTPQGTFFLHESSMISVPSEGSISIKAPGIELSGQLHALSGDVQLTASGGVVTDIVLNPGSKILAGGYNRPQTSAPANNLRTNFTPVDGGSVCLKSKLGSIDVKQGALIDVSGSAPVVNQYRGADRTIYTGTVASDPGSVSFSYHDNLDLSGSLNARHYMEGLSGGSLTIGRTNTLEALSIAPGMIDFFTDDGFDAFTFSSYSDLIFQGDPGEELLIQAGRRLTLDAPEIIANNLNIHLKAPWIQLSNTDDKYDRESLGSGFDPGSLMPDEVQSGESMLRLQGNFIDVAGSLGLSGFKNVSLEAGNDLCFDEEYYGSFWEGKLLVPGDLSFTASCIYPTTDSRFTIQSGGKVTTCSNARASADTIYSAEGSLKIEAQDIEHNGFLAAPLGEIVLETNKDGGRIFLGEGSVISVRGALPVKYGAQGIRFWTKTDKDNPGGDPIMVETAPEGAVTISANTNGEIIMKKGAEINVSGGGAIFSYSFQPGTEGTRNPLNKDGTYVIVPGIQRPGPGVYLNGEGGLSGKYSLLPGEFALLPGAMVITDLGELDQPVMPDDITEQGYPVVTGYMTVMDTNIKSPRPNGFAVRPARDVLQEGSFSYGEFQGGNAGSVALNGSTTILDGTIKGEALPGYQGGFLSMSAAENAVVRAIVSLPSEFGFGDSIPGNLVGKCMISSDGLAGRGLRELNIGDINTTNTITLKDGSILDAPIVALSAKDSITLESGARIEAVGDGGTASLISPDGKVIIKENALVHASDAVNLETSNLFLDGEMKVDNSSLNLQGANIFIVPDGYTRDEDDADGIYLTESLWGLTGFDNIGFISRNDLAFKGSIDLEVAEELTIDAKRIAGLDIDGENTSNITSQTINLLNTTGEASGDAGLADTCLVTFNADDMTVGHGVLLFDGFSDINLKNDSDLTFKGKGSLTSNGNLNMNAARVTTSYYKDSETPYVVANFQVNAGTHALTIAKSGGTPGQTKIPGGSLEFLAGKIDHSGIVDVTSGRVKFVAAGSGANEGIFLRDGSQILARGSDYAPGGLVDLQTEQGALNIEEGSKIDVSAGGQGDAGAVSLYAPAEGVVIDGDVDGYSQGGRGGSFALDTKELDNFSSLNAKLAAGGFNEEVNIRTRSRDVEIAVGDTVVAHKFNLTVDKTEGGNDGNINLLGEIDASGDKGGTVELYAGNDLNLDGTIDVHSSRAGLPGGEVFLSAAAGTVNFNSNSSIDVSAGENGEGGKVSFRALRTAGNNEVNMNLAGTITGASCITAEAVKVYTDTSISSSNINTWKNETLTFMTNAGTIKTRLFTGLTADEFHLLPGLEIQSATDLTLASAWDLTEWRYGADDHPGVLTLRAAGDLDINYDLVDHPTSKRAFFIADGLRDSWEINLIAGADKTGANPFQINSQETGDFTVKEGKLIYTESAPLRFFSGGDTHIEKEQDYSDMPDYMFNLKMPYNIATYDGIIKGVAGRDLIFDHGSGAIHSAVGDIHLSVGNDLDLVGNGQGILLIGGAVRTTGTLIEGAPSSIYECYNNGGDIQIDAGGDIEGSINNRAWDQSVAPSIRMWTARYANDRSDNLRTTAGIATMSGGDIAVTTGGDVFAQIGAFGDDKEDMLSINSMGNINGRFLVRKGAGEIHSLGNFGADRYENQHIELFDAQIHLTAQGDVDIGAILNPTISRPCFSYDSASWIGGASGSKQSLQYTEQSAAVIKSVTGDIILHGKSGPYEEGENECGKTQRALPPTVEMYAPEGDINFEQSFVLAPSSTGNLVLSAGGNISGTYIDDQGKRAPSVIAMSDRNPATVYNDYELFNGVAKVYEDWNAMDMNIDMFYNGLAYSNLLDRQGAGPVKINAGGDVSGFSLYFPKKMEITAGRDIRDFKIFSQNLNADDISFLKAGRNIAVQSSETAFKDDNATYRMGVSHGGPGSLIVQAGNSIDLGISKGLQTTSVCNPYLDGSSSLYVISGYDKGWNPEEINDYFSDLREAGNEYAVLLGTDQSAAMQKIEEFRENVMGPFFSGSSTGAGNIEMTESRIKTTEEDGDLYILAAGDINAGQSMFKSETKAPEGQDYREQTGIFTESGGPLNIFSVGDLNVLESRVMTFSGGDITIWSDRGSINAGRGSKTAISKPETGIIRDPDTREVVGRYIKPPAVGSGIRTLTYDPDGFEGPLEAPEPGDAYIFAPEGVIDAGEAGISAKNVILGATAVLNAQNIEVTGVSVGVPVASDGVSGLGSIAGAGSLTETSGLTDDVAGLDTGEDVAEGYSEPEAFIPTWLKVKVVGFDEEEDDENIGGQE